MAVILNIWGLGTFSLSREFQRLSVHHRIHYKRCSKMSALQLLDLTDADLVEFTETHSDEEIKVLLSGKLSIKLQPMHHPALMQIARSLGHGGRNVPKPQLLSFIEEEFDKSISQTLAVLKGGDSVVVEPSSSKRAFKNEPKPGTSKGSSPRPVRRKIPVHKEDQILESLSRTRPPRNRKPPAHIQDPVSAKLDTIISVLEEMREMQKMIIASHAEYQLDIQAIKTHLTEHEEF